jgi:hypothetical protein
MHESTCSEDDARWSNDRSPVSPTNMIWLFEHHFHSSNHTLHVFHKTTNEYKCISLHHQTILQIGLLDLEYWANMAETPRSSNANRIARYLERLRSDLWAELTTSGQDFLQRFQPITTRFWAVRTNHNFGHSNLGKTKYREKCKENGWIPYNHENPASYSKNLNLSYRYQTYSY